MFSFIEHENTIKDAREQFITTGLVSSDLVRPIILNSWERCKNAGVDPEIKHASEVLSYKKLEEKRKLNQVLINVASPIMFKLQEFVRGTGFIISLADNEGYLLQVIGDDDVAETVQRGNFKPGANWSETSIGTNAIGTSIIENQALQVFSYEHYCKCSLYWTCSAAPINNPDTNEIMGVLCITGEYKRVHSHTLGMAYASAHAIENEFTLRNAWLTCEVVNNEKSQVINSISEGIIAINPTGQVTHVNKAACKLFGFNEARVLHQNINNVLGPQNRSILSAISESMEINDKQVTVFSLASQDKYSCTLTLRLIKDDSEKYQGKVIILSESKRVQKIAQQMLGNYAQFSFNVLIGNNSTFKKSVELARSSANSKSNVLLLGESGTGKEVFAQSIHNESPRKNGPFLAINCSGIPRELISSELFGYAEGTFTGAKKGGKPGKFELANGGTLFLDEIGDMPMELQSYLLRVLEEKRVMRLGSGETIPIDVRIISATNKDLWQEVKENNFRSDLFYRINVFTIKMTPLRKRKDDIEELVNYFMEKYSYLQEKTIEHISPEVLDIFKKYDWPGNIRQLQNSLERMINIARDNKLTADLIPEEISNSTSNFSGNPLNSLEDNEQKIIQELLESNNYNISKVSRELNVSRPTLYRKLEKYGMPLNKKSAEEN